MWLVFSSSDYNKVREDKNDLKMELLIKKEDNFKIWKNSQPFIAKK